MTVKPILLDTSALLTLIEDEAGAARVEQVLRAGTAIIVWTSLLEVVYVTQQERGVPEAERRYALLKVLPVTLLWSMDEPILLIAARFKAAYRSRLQMRLLRPMLRTITRYFCIKTPIRGISQRD